MSKAPQTVQLYRARRPPPERQLAFGLSLTAVRAAWGTSCQVRLHTSIRQGAHGCLISSLRWLIGPRLAKFCTRNAYKPVGAAAALRTHGQDGYFVSASKVSAPTDGRPCVRTGHGQARQ
jgi:hypothetical protein